MFGRPPARCSRRPGLLQVFRGLRGPMARGPHHPSGASARPLGSTLHPVTAPSSATRQPEEVSFLHSPPENAIGRALLHITGEFQNPAPFQSRPRAQSAGTECLGRDPSVFWVIWGNQLAAPCLNFLICKIATPSQEGCESQMS